MVKSNISEEIMKTDPYSLYYEDLKSIRENNQKKRLTRNKIFDIIIEEMEEASASEHSEALKNHLKIIEKSSKNH